MRDYLRLAYKVLCKSSPEQIIFFVTSKCNFNCKMCFYKSSMKSTKNELSLKEIQQISSGMRPFYWLQLSGGEPFLRDDLDGICGSFIRNNRTKIINIPTNAYFVERVVNIAKRMLSSQPRTFFNIGVSILGLSKIHDDTTGTLGSFDKAVSCYWQLKKLKRIYSNLGLNFIVTQTRYNEKNLKGLFDFLMKECCPDHIAFNIARGEDIDHKYSDVSAEIYRENQNYLERLVSQREDYYFKLPLRSLLYAVNMLQKDITYETVSKDKFIIPCYAGRISAVIDETGNLFPCELRKQPLGNLRDHGYNFKSIWSGEAAQAERTAIKRTGCFCPHECFITTNILFNPRIYPRLLKRWVYYMIRSRRKR